ncbi:MAG: methyl-accepting chemotaxis protein [Pirellulaceae bacterium]|nr:methyl-accepting chemotaxis protein [Pirellulaceae bacterium]
MSIRSLLLTVFVTLLGLLAALIYVASMTTQTQGEMAAAERRRLDSWKLADELRQSSDDLTRMARTFVVTGNPAYERYFNDILAIRNGEKGRPEGYDGIYWDFVIAAGGQTQATGSPIALEQLMRDMAFTPEEFAKLAEAQRRSDALVRLEERAMNAMNGRFDDGSGNFTVENAPDPKLARELMHGEEYHKAKAAIMTPIREFFAMLDKRTANDVKTKSTRVRHYARIALGLTIGTAAFALVAFLTLVRLTVTPIRAMIERLKDIAEGEGDMTQRVDESRRNELGELGHWFNTFIQMVHDILCRVKRTSETVATAAGEIAGASRDQQAMVGDFSASSGQIAAAIKEISTTGKELAITLKEVSQIASESAVIADTGKNGLSNVESNIQALLESTRSISSKLNVIDERSEGINQIVTTIVKVADQTNLLSVNAAIEAQKAGEYGVGFRVVAHETRRLADQTAKATLEIEQDVGETQSAVSEGVAEMDRLKTRVGELVAATSVLSEQLGTIIEQVHTLTDRFESVNEGMSQQSQGTLQINQTMTSLTGNADRTASSSAEFASAAEQLREATVTLQNEIERFKLMPGDSPRRGNTES